VLVGVDHPSTLRSWPTRLALATVAIAGIFLRRPDHLLARAGAEPLIFAFEAVIIGGLGSLWGTWSAAGPGGGPDPRAPRSRPAGGCSPATWCSCRARLPAVGLFGKPVATCPRPPRRAAPRGGGRRGCAAAACRIGRGGRPWLAVAIACSGRRPCWARTSVLRTLTAYFTLLGPGHHVGTCSPATPGLVSNRPAGPTSVSGRLTACGGCRTRPGLDPFAARPPWPPWPAAVLSVPVAVARLPPASAAGDDFAPSVTWVHRRGAAAVLVAYISLLWRR
jgi:hypothetical protein